MEILTWIPNPFAWRSTLPFVGIGLLLALLMFAAGGALHSMEYKKSVSLYGLYGVVGKFGKGKSYLCAWLVYDAFKRGRPVYANIVINNDKRPCIGKTNKLGPPAVFLTDWHGVLNVPDGSLIILDEVHTWWPVDATRPPAEIRSFISQIRKRDITMVWNSQIKSNVSGWLRKLSFGIFDASKFRKGHLYRLYECHPTRDEHYKSCKAVSSVYLRRQSKVEALYDHKALTATAMEWGDGSGAGEARGPSPRTRPPTAPDADDDEPDRLSDPESDALLPSGT